MKTWLVASALALFACLVFAVWRPESPPAPGIPAVSVSNVFAVRVEKPAANRPLAGLFGLIPSDDLGFTHESPGAASGVFGRDRLEFRAQGWELSIETDREGRVAPATRLVFPSWLRRANDPRPVALRCRPADRGIKIAGFKGWRSRLEGWDADIGHVRFTTPADVKELSGEFLVAVATCENVESGRSLDWPNAPLIVRGRFDHVSKK